MLQRRGGNHVMLLHKKITWSWAVLRFQGD